MVLTREVRTQISSIRKIQKITSAMQNVSASKMRRAQQYMAASMSYATKIGEVVGHIANSAREYEHPYFEEHEQIKKIGYILVSTDRGLCSGLNLNLFKFVMEHARIFEKQGIDIEWCLIGRKAELFFQSLSANVIAHVSGLGEKPQASDLLGVIKVMADAYRENEINKLFIVHNEFINSIVLKPKIMQLLPIQEGKSGKNYCISYIYEPAPKILLDTLVSRYIETQVYQAVVDNLACEQVARMMAMKNATENSKEIIEDLQVMYNKARQGAITAEIAEIVSGADATV